MAPLVGAECPHCGAAHPRRVAAVVLTAILCVRCGDDDQGPWLDADDGLICEACDDEAVAS